MFEGLWDTGSMISLISKTWLDFEFPKQTVYPIESFIGAGEGEFSLKAANNSEIDIEGIVLFDFGISNHDEKFTVPFIVTNQNIDNPIIGYNIIEHIITNIPDQKHNPVLTKMFPKLNPEKTEPVVNLIQANFSNSDSFEQIKTSCDIEIPPNATKYVKCKIRSCNHNISSTRRTIPVIFLPDLNWDSNLILAESLTYFKPNRAPFVKVPVFNPTNYKISLKSKSVIGTIEQISAVIPLNFENIKVPSESSPSDTAGAKNDFAPKEKWLPGVDLSHLPEEQRIKVQKLLTEECEVFAEDKNDIGQIDNFKLKLNLKDETPVQKAYRSIPKHLYSELKIYIEDLLTNKWIRNYYSSYASPMVCVRKKDGTMRLCIDYRELNKKIIPDKMPIPRINDILDNLGGNTYFSTLDMTKAYHQGFMHENSQHLTAFTTPWGLYEWLRIPFGLSNAPPSFQRFMNECLGDLRDTICISYLDDILCFSKNFDEHLTNLRTVLQKLKEHKIKLKAEKCVFFQQEVKYLGKIINSSGYRDDPINTEAIEKLRQPPKNIGDLRKLLGFVGYYRSSIQNFSRIAKPLYELLTKENLNIIPSNRKNSSKKTKGQKSSKEPIQFTETHQNVLNLLIDKMISPEVMSFPDFSKRFTVHCDASESGLGAVLYQEQNQKLKVISYASRTLTPAEKIIIYIVENSNF